MLYLAALFLAMAVALIGADYAGVRAAHSAGVTGTMFILLAAVCVVIREVRFLRHHHHHG